MSEETEKSPQKLEVYKLSNGFYACIIREDGAADDAMARAIKEQGEFCFFLDESDDRLLESNPHYQEFIRAMQRSKGSIGQSAAKFRGAVKTSAELRSSMSRNDAETKSTQGGSNEL